MTQYIVCNHPQGSAEWLTDRIGKITGSVVEAVFAEGRGGKESITKKKLRVQKAMEIIKGEPYPEGFKSAAMMWGNEQEPHARMRYELETGLDVAEMGFIYLPGIAAGVSVDGAVVDGGRRGFVEFKCPDTHTHMDYLVADAIPPEYLPQITHEFWVTGYDFCDFVSYDPRVEDCLQLFVKRVWRDEAAVQKHAAGVITFTLEVDKQVKEYRALIERRRAAKAANQTFAEAA